MTNRSIVRCAVWCGCWLLVDCLAFGWFWFVSLVLCLFNLINFLPCNWYIAQVICCCAQVFIKHAGCECTDTFDLAGWLSQFRMYYEILCLLLLSRSYVSRFGVVVVLCTENITNGNIQLSRQAFSLSPKTKSTLTPSGRSCFFFVSSRLHAHSRNDSTTHRLNFPQTVFRLRCLWMGNETLPTAVLMSIEWWCCCDCQSHFCIDQTNIMTFEYDFRLHPEWWLMY